MYRYFRYIVPVLLTIIHSVCNITSCELYYVNYMHMRFNMLCAHHISCG